MRLSWYTGWISSTCLRHSVSRPWRYSGAMLFHQPFTVGECKCSIPPGVGKSKCCCRTRFCSSGKMWGVGARVHWWPEISHLPCPLNSREDRHSSCTRRTMCYMECHNTDVAFAERKSLVWRWVIVSSIMPEICRHSSSLVGHAFVCTKRLSIVVLGQVPNMSS